VLAAAAGCRVTAWHVDHRLRPGSGDEADVVADAARRYGAEFRAVAVDVGPGPNLEDRARRARRGVLPAHACTGHTADDQAETVLLALVRGAGLDGLTGMGPERHPLLAIRHAETVALCEAEGLVPVVDPSNDDLGMRRNRIRHQLLPLASDITGRDLVPILARTAALLRADAEVLAAAVGELDPADADALVAAPVGVARRAVRAWLVGSLPEGSAPYPPSAAAVERVLAVSRGEALACEVAGVGRIARHHRRLVVEGR
jgi:tRNA(Ile)-lysidine synthase